MSTNKQTISKIDSSMLMTYTLKALSTLSCSEFHVTSELRFRRTSLFWKPVWNIPWTRKGPTLPCQCHIAVI